LPVPFTPPDHLPTRGAGILAGQATGVPAWEGAEADWEPAEAPDWDPADLADRDSGDWDSAEPVDWDPAELADWELVDLDGKPLGLAASGPEAPGPRAPSPRASGLRASGLEASGLGVERRGPGCTEAGSREAPKPAPGARTRGDGGWFATGGVADGLLPGPRLAGFMADAGAIGLSRLTDDELIGLMRAARRLASWSAATELAAAGDLWRRRWAEEQAGNTGAARHADDEIAAALTLTRRAADQVLSLAIALRRLPLTSRALTAGDIDLPRAMVIADEVTGLGNEHAAAVEQAIINAAAGQTTGQLRAATRRAVLSADPRAARKRKERALQDARVERWDEHGGTAALAGRDLPPASVLAADKNLSALARQLQRAGVPGTLDQLRAQVYLALLTGSPVDSLISATPGPAADMSSNGSPRGSTGPVGDSPARATSSGFGPPAGPSAFGVLGVPSDPGLSDGPGTTGTSASPVTTGMPASPGTSACPGAPGTSASPGTPGAFYASGTVNLTMPLASWLGTSDAPGNVAGFGPLDADDSRAIADALAARADTRWCLTLTDTHGRPVAHGCARAGPPPSQHRPKQPAGPPGAQETGSPGVPSGSPRDRPPGNSHSKTAGGAHERPAGGVHERPTDGAPDRPAGGSRDGPADGPEDGPADSPRDGPRTRAPSEPGARVPSRTWTFRLTLLAGGSCDHAYETAAYRPSPRLRHLTEIRHATCTYPGCRRPATRCDADHTVAYHRGGRTCLCNLAPLCRKHHRCKQAKGWRLEQPDPGVLVWQTPSGRAYTITPTEYPV